MILACFLRSGKAPGPVECKWSRTGAGLVSSMVPQLHGRPCRDASVWGRGVVPSRRETRASAAGLHQALRRPHARPLERCDTVP
jgi:hypothetical protein